MEYGKDPTEVPITEPQFSHLGMGEASAACNPQVVYDHGPDDTTPTETFPPTWLVIDAMI